MFEAFTLGAVQGIAEWLPVSSEAMIILIKNNFFNSGMKFSEMINFAIFLHLGTLLAVIVYYWKKIIVLIQNFFSYKTLSLSRKKYLDFIVITTIISGIVGLSFIKIVNHFEYLFHNEIIINTIVAVFLLLTAVLLYITEQKNEKESVLLTKKRAFITGIFQGISAIPGISRSGSTVAGMGLLGIDKERALELSFILSVPIVLLANIILNYHEFVNITLNRLIALFSAFVFGIITIDILLRLVRQVRFSYFVGFFGVILIIVNLMIV